MGGKGNEVEWARRAEIRKAEFLAIIKPGMQIVIVTYFRFN